MNRLNHVAFIMDGNGRWGIKKKNSRNYGHLEGVKTVQKIVKASIKFKVPIITLYVFSSENWKRPKSETNYLFNLINIYFKKELKNIIKNNIKIIISGRINLLPNNIQKILMIAKKKTLKNKKLKINLAINYGSKNELIDAVKRTIKNKKNITEKNIEDNFYNKLPPPDILIRTGGKKRLSNFMLWQLAYTELYFLSKLWPDFKEHDLKKIISNFKIVKRNFGNI